MMSPPSLQLSLLPDELLLLIAEHLGPASLNSLIQTSHQFELLVNDSLWDVLFRAPRRHYLARRIFVDAAGRGNLTLMRKMDETFGMDSDTKADSLREVADNGDTGVVAYLMQYLGKRSEWATCPCKYDQFTYALARAARHEYVEVIRLLMEYEPKREDMQLGLQHALHGRGDAKAARMLLMEYTKPEDRQALVVESNAWRKLWKSAVRTR